VPQRLSFQENPRSSQRVLESADRVGVEDLFEPVGVKRRELDLFQR
jgi:hypothetical protein